MITRVSFILLVILCFGGDAFASDTCRIFFKDKGLSQLDLTPGSSRFESVIASLSDAAIERRKRALSFKHDWETISQEDFDVNANYLSAIEQLGAKVLHSSKWLNFATVACDANARGQIIKLDFVDRVAKLGRVRTVIAAEDCGADSIVFHRGYAAWQLDRINTGPMHWLGIDATGVAIAYFDTGFIWRENIALDHLNVIGEYDFVAKDTIVSQQPGDNPGQYGHGSNVLAVATGLLPDSMIGPAYHANILLGKTEDLNSETPLEEENYALGLEWAEAKGARIASSSLGYLFFDSGFTSYTYEDLDGKTAISTKAASHAAKLGMLVVSAAGNNGTTAFPWVNTPADADSILAVGAYFFNDTIVDFSARGPSADGRIKPDIAAPGVGVWTYDIFLGLVPVTGTSHATPLVSSSAALIMQAHPEAGAQEVRKAIMETGSNAAHPDTVAGWGMLNTYAAALKLGPFFGKITQKFNSNVLDICVGFASNASTNSLIFRYRRNGGAYQDIALTERFDSNYYALSEILPGKPGDRFEYHIVAASSSGDTLILPKDYPQTSYSVVIGDSVVHAEVGDRAPGISHSRIYPNPAVNFVEVESDELIIAAEIIDIAGRSIMASPSTTERSKRFLVSDLASGSYMIRVTFANGSQEMHQLRIAR
jgi:serine protease AprX